jgi:hypothetical protein
MHDDTNQNFVKVKLLGFLFLFCPFNVAFVFLELFMSFACFFLLCSTSTLDFVKVSNSKFFFLCFPVCSWFCLCN